MRIDIFGFKYKFLSQGTYTTEGNISKRIHFNNKIQK